MDTHKPRWYFAADLFVELPERLRWSLMLALWVLAPLAVEHWGGWWVFTLVPTFLVTFLNGAEMGLSKCDLE